MFVMEIRFYFFYLKLIKYLNQNFFFKLLFYINRDLCGVSF